MAVAEQPVVWDSNACGPEWSAKAQSMVGEGKLAVRPAGPPGEGGFTVDGPCPRCAHWLSYQDAAGAVLQRLVRGPGRSSSAEVSVACMEGRAGSDCRHGGPDGKSGCGMWAVVEVAV